MNLLCFCILVSVSALSMGLGCKGRRWSQGCRCRLLSVLLSLVTMARTPACFVHKGFFHTYLWVQFCDFWSQSRASTAVRTYALRPRGFHPVMRARENLRFTVGLTLVFPTVASAPSCRSLCIRSDHLGNTVRKAALKMRKCKRRRAKR